MPRPHTIALLLALSGALALGAGDLHHTLAAPVYEAAPDGSGAVSPTVDHGRWRAAFVPSLSLGVGWAFGAPTEVRWSVALCQAVALELPDNGSAVVRLFTALRVTAPRFT